MPSEEPAATGPAYFTVDPDKIHHVIHGLEDEIADLKEFLAARQTALISKDKLGADPRSEIVANELSENGQSAVDAVNGYIQVLGNIVQQLRETAKAYGLTEEGNAAQLRNGPP